MHAALTSSAREALDQSQAEARMLNQEFVGTEHLALALLKSHGSLASRTLNQQRVDREAVRSQLLAVMPYSETPPVVTGQLPLSPKAQRTISSAIVMARSLRENKVSTRVLLLALLSEEGTPFVQALRDTGVDAAELLRGLAEKPAEQES